MSCVTELVLDIIEGKLVAISALHASDTRSSEESWLVCTRIVASTCILISTAGFKHTGISSGIRVDNIASDDWTTVIIEEHRIGLNELVTLLNRLFRE